MLIAIWIACGVFHYGLWVAYFRREYPWSDPVNERLWGVVTAAFGPAALFADLMTWWGWRKPIWSRGWML